MKKHITDNHYPKDTYRLLAEIEPKHFWFSGRNLILKTFIQKTIPKIRNVSFLEVGCGTGYVLAFLESLGFRVTGVDMNKGAFRYARKRTHARLYSGNIENISLPQFQCVGAFDVLEHVGKEAEFLQACRRLLRPGGYLYLMVPAHMHLWSTIDEVAGHKRRYGANYIGKLLKKQGFRVTRVSFYGAFYYIPLLIQRLYLRSFPHREVREKHQILKSALHVPSQPLNSIFYLSMRLENFLLKFIDIPFGASIILCAQKVTKKSA